MYGLVVVYFNKCAVSKIIVSFIVDVTPLGAFVGRSQNIGGNEQTVPVNIVIRQRLADDTSRIK